jgi:hypothetical protein
VVDRHLLATLASMTSVVTFASALALEHFGGRVPPPWHDVSAEGLTAEHAEHAEMNAGVACEAPIILSVLGVLCG